MRKAAFLLIGLLALSASAPAEAGLFHRKRCRPAPRPCHAATAPAAVSVGVSVNVSAASATDPASFLSWVNGYRAAAGLGDVAWDAGLAADAAHNSSLGYNHNFMGRARRQNVGKDGTLASISAAWAADPPHNSALLDPTITRVAVATVNGVTTYSAY